MIVGRVGFEPTITGARDRYHLCPDGILDQAVPTEGWSGPPPLTEAETQLPNKPIQMIVMARQT